MGGFDRIETALRARDIIKKAANSEARTVYPQPLVGRMMSVDLPRLRGTVWFPNDEQPILVNIFANAIPAEWQHKLTTPEDFSSTEGRGAMVVVERLNDALWVTHVLTGQTAALDMRALGLNIMAQEAAPTAAGGPSADAIVDIAGPPHETFINCHIKDTTLLPTEAIEFGPFTTFNEGTPSAGYMEITVRMEPNVIKSYRFVADPANEFDNIYYSSVNAIWFRLIAEQEITTGPWAGTGADFDDFDLDISFKKTAYGNTVFFEGYKEMWFRIIRRSTGTGIDAMVTIRATNVQKGRSLGGRELFMQEKQTSPTIHWGVLGFHGANHGWNRAENFTYDVFNRIAVDSWGQSNTQVAYTSNLGSANLYSVNGQNGIIAINANNNRYHQRQNESRTNFDGTMIVKPGRVATGAPIRMGFMTNFDAGTSNCWMFSLVFGTAGTATAVIEKRVAGVVSTLATSATTLAYSATSRLRIRFQTVNNGTAQTYRVKMWGFGFREPQTWTVTATETATRAAGTWGMYAQADTGNTNTKNFDVLFEDVQVNTAFGTPTANGHATNWHTGPWRSGQLRMATGLQKTWTHDGQFILQDFSGVSYLKWSGNIWLDGIGSHRNGLHNGRAFIQIPSEGPFFDLRVYPGGGLVTIDPFFGFPLSPGQSLWCAVPPECGYDNLVYNIFWVDGQALQDYILPEWAVLIAARGPTGSVPDVRLGNGDHLDLWRAMTLQNGWANRVGSFPLAAYRMLEGGNVQVVFNITGGTTTDGTVITTLPVGFRTQSEIILSSKNHLLGFYPDGTVKVFSSASAFIQVSGIFPTTAP